MTTLVHCAPIVTTRIDLTPAQPVPAAVPAPAAPPAAAPAPAPAAGPAAGDDYTVAVYLNREPHSVTDYQSGHIMTEAHTTDGAPLRLFFHAERFTDPELDTDERDVAEAALCVGDGYGEDDHDQPWPTHLPPLSVGDVVAVITSTGTTAHLSIAPRGFTRIHAPAHLVTHATTHGRTARSPRL